jgi:hypothetical protein
VNATWLGAASPMTASPTLGVSPPKFSAVKFVAVVPWNRASTTKAPAPFLPSASNCSSVSLPSCTNRMFSANGSLGTPPGKRAARKAARSATSPPAPGLKSVTVTESPMDDPNTSVSAPSPSVTTLVPPDLLRTTRSAPAPASSTSSPSPPSRVSAPAPPNRRSLPSMPSRSSSPSPPSSVSAPPIPKRSSPPSPPIRRLS